MLRMASSANLRHTINQLAAVRNRAFEVTMQPDHSAFTSAGRFRGWLPLFPPAFALILFLCAMDLTASGQMQTVSIIKTFAGNGTVGFSGDGGQAIDAAFDFPRSPGFDSAGNLY